MLLKRRTFKLKLCIWIFGISVSIFAMIFVANLYYVSEEVRQDVRATAFAKLDFVLQALDEGLSTTEVSAENLVGISHSPLIPHKRDSILTILEQFLMANPRVQGVALGFDHAVTSDKEKGFCPYVLRMQDGSFMRQDVATTHDYISNEWYKHTVETQKSNWSKPFREDNGIIVTTYNVPMYDDSGHFYGVLGVALNLNIINDHIQELKPYPNSMLTVVDADGTFIAHPHSEYILVESIQSLIEKNKEGANKDMFDSIKKGVRGVGDYNGANGKTYVFYAPENRTDWTVTLEVPQNDIAPGLARMSRILLVVILLGIITMLAVCVVVINRLTKPLEAFAEVARQIAKGNFDNELPEIKDKNELYDLHQALASMKESLQNYITELEETTKGKALIEGELNIARKIQMAMIPKIFPPYPDRPELDIYGSLTPAKAVGGDLYDYVLDGDDFYFCIGDVSGKGVPASLFMAITRSLFRNNVTHAKSPAAVATLLNNAIAQGNDENMFVTMFIGCCNLKTGRFTCCNCGHNAPATNGDFVCKDPLTVAPQNEVHLMKQVPINLPIGVFEGFEFKEVSMQLEPGIKILLYTDGITEAENPNAELYGDDRLLDLLSHQDVKATAEQVIKALIDDVHLHANGAEQSDDITVLCIKYCPEKE